MSGHLYIVSTPIGNLSDMTYRAVETLKSVDLIAAEDTRHSRKLLDHYQITTPCLSLHEHNEQARAQLLCDRLEKGQHIALISDAGTPLISDPGYRLVARVREAGIRVVPIPGPCAAIAALVASGLPTEQFLFVGFLPAKGALRKKKLITLKNEPHTLIFYESVHRITDLIDLLNEVFEKDRLAAIARELTKTYETIHQASLANLQQWLKEFPGQCKGEFVVIVEGVTEKKTNEEMMPDYQRVLTLLLPEMSLKQAVNLTCQITGGKRKAIYSLALTLAKEK